MSAVPQLAAAVSNAGALGMLALTWSRQSVALARKPQSAAEIVEELVSRIWSGVGCH